MTATIKTYIEAIAVEKNLDAEEIFLALELALATATEKTIDEEMKLQCDVDRKTGEANYFRVWTVVSNEQEDFDAGSEIRISDTKPDYDNLSIGDEIVEEIDLTQGEEQSGNVGRIEIEKAKQVMIKAVRDAERSQNARNFESQIGEIMIGEVSHVTRSSVVIDTPNAQAEIPRSELLPKEIIRKGDHIQGCLQHINISGRGPLLQLSRRSNEMLSALFTQEVPEITEGLIQIKSIARDPGSRAKIAVKSNDSRIDPIGACIGMKGSRVQAISSELHGERVDIIQWSDDPAILALNALQPAEVQSIELNEDNRSMSIAIDSAMLPQAIGRSGQNINLASQLVGWKLKIMSEEEAAEITSRNIETAKQIFSEKIDVDEDVAETLAKESIRTLSDLANSDIITIAAINGLNVEIAEELISRAKDHLLDVALSGDESTESLMSIEGMTMSITEQLQANKINNRDELADMSVDELTDSIQIDEKKAAEIILAARSHWFEDSDQ
ncbi:transcription termination factor NusA [Gammaproteobacteria bacterium]|nr:transcription termination factor NusA [Gammaproteobacteria bacterium]